MDIHPLPARSRTDQRPSVSNLRHHSSLEAKAASYRGWIDGHRLPLSDAFSTLGHRTSCAYCVSGGSASLGFALDAHLGVRGLRTRPDNGTNGPTAATSMAEGPTGREVTDFTVPDR